MPIVTMMTYYMLRQEDADYTYRVIAEVSVLRGSDDIALNFAEVNVFPTQSPKHHRIRPLCLTDATPTPLDLAVYCFRENYASEPGLLSMRPLLPRTAPKTTPNTVDSDVSTNRVPEKRRHVVIACITCRKRKTRCDGLRPTCSRCNQRASICTYPIRKKIVTVTPGESAATSDGSDTLDRLCSLPYNRALALLQEIRGDEGPLTSGEDFRRDTDFEQPTLLYSPNQGCLMRASLPSTRNSLEFELAVRHPIAYPVLHPVHFACLPITGMIDPVRIRKHELTQLVHQPKAWSCCCNLVQSGPPDESYIEAIPDPLNIELHPTTVLADPRLLQLEIGHWTNVRISNGLAACIISLYFQIDYPILPVFNMDLFITDLTLKKTGFCSRALVSALLSWGCQAYTAVNPEAAALGAQFFVEAKAQLTKEAHINTLTAVSALELLSMTCVTHGRDDAALWYLEQGIRTGKNMGIFDVHAEKVLSPNDVFPTRAKEWRIAASYTGWGVFNWACIYGLHYQRCEIKIPPLHSLPGQVAVEPPYTSNPTQERNIEIFDASCKLWTIFSEVLSVYYAQNGKPTFSQQSSLEFAEKIYRRLLCWAAQLPMSLVRSPESSHAVLMLHVYFHAIITDVFRPFSLISNRLLRLSSFESPQATPESAYAGSINQLKRLLLVYRLNFKTATLSVLWQTGLVYVANAMVRDTRESSNERRYYIFLCLAGLEDLSVNFRVFGTIAKGLLGMALKCGAVKKREAKRIIHELSEVATLHKAVEQLEDDKIVANWIIDLDLALNDTEAASGTRLEEQFGRMISDDGI